jgi:hypothetical protein
MISKSLSVGLALLVVTVVGGMLAVLHLDNARLRRHLVVTQQKKAQLDQLREETRSTKVLLARSEADAADGARAIHEEVLRARAEVADLEQKAAALRDQKRAQTQAVAEALAKNRDPEKGLTRLEHFKEVGQATPSAAFQSLVWAALNGDDTVLANVVGMTVEARQRAEAWVATWPAEALPKPTPEKLAATVMSGPITEVPALHILSAAIENDGRTATLSVRVPHASKPDATERVPMQLGPKGWYVVVSENQIERLQKKLRAAGTEQK